MNQKLMFIQKPVYNVYSSIIHKHQKLETILSFYWWMDEQIIVHPNNGTPLSEKKELTCGTYKDIVGSQMHYAKWNSPDSKTQKHTSWFHFYDIQEKAKLQRQNRDSSCQGLKGKTKNRKGTFGDSWNVLYLHGHHYVIVCIC